MKFYKKFIDARLSILLLSAVLILSSCGYERIGTNPNLPKTDASFYANRETPISAQFEDFYLSVFREEMEDGNTLDLHYTLLRPQAYGIDTKEPTLGTYRLQDMVANNKRLKELKEQLLHFDREQLSTEHKLTFDALLEVLETRLMSEGLELYEQPLAPTIGVQAQLPILLAEYAFYSAEDVEDYLALVEEIDDYYREILLFEQQKADAGLGPSDASIDAIIESCRGYLPAITNDFSQEPSSNSAPGQTVPTSFNTDDHILSQTFLTRLTELETQGSITGDQKASWISRHDRAIREHFIPAYEELIAGMTALKGRGINDGGLAGFQNGTDYYEYLVASGPASSYSVPELKKALTERMEQDLWDMNQLFVTYPDLADRITNARFTLTDPLEILDDLKQKMNGDFPELPACDYEICYVPKALESVLSPAFYLTAPLDNANQNIIYINNAYSADNLYTTLAHEGFPGHLYQTVYARMKQKNAPLLSVLSCSGANEGWATYVEYLANLYDNGLPDGVGMYEALLRSYSLCIHGLLDIGINYEGWNRETANAFLSSHFQIDEATIDQLWQMMIDNPTNYLCYCGGFLEIMEMRDEAERTLGADFSLLEFHRFLLDTGPLPFSVIRTRFKEWLEQS